MVSTIVPVCAGNGHGRVALVNITLGKCQIDTDVCYRDGWCPVMKHGMEQHMNDKNTKAPSAGGAIIALLTLVGTFAGGYFARQPVIGFLAGLGSGILIAVLIWLKDRKA